MKLDSKYFDIIRVKPDRARGEDRERHPCCQWQGCVEAGVHRAPRGRGREGEYLRFCYEHVREYNSNYNYFAGMSDDDVARFQKDAMTGHRPTWRMGSGTWQHNGSGTDRYDETTERLGRFAEAFRARARWQRGQDGGAEPREPRRRTVRPLERKHLETLNLAETASRADIKARFKELVKLHHPDLNGGDRRSEDKLREVIQAYTFLKQVGLA